MKEKPTIAAWPRLLSLDLAAIYCSVGKRTIEGWIQNEILHPVVMPGAFNSNARKLVRVLIDRNDLDVLIEIGKKKL